LFIIIEALFDKKQRKCFLDIDEIRPIKWQTEKLFLLDQRSIPENNNYVECSSCDDVVDSIKNMIVRGAPAIGVAGAYAMVLSWINSHGESQNERQKIFLLDAEKVRLARPTAVNLQWAVNTMVETFKKVKSECVKTSLEHAAVAMHREDLLGNYKMGDLGSEFLESDSKVMTHCNAGAFATTGYGTALGVIKSGWSKKFIKHVFITETRPWLQGSRLTATELRSENISHSIIVDSAAASVMKSEKIDWIIIGADRIAKNGDVANKIGSYSLAVLANFHRAKFMVVAPTSSIDSNCDDGATVPIEYRDGKELLRPSDRDKESLNFCINPVFDITPAALIDVLVTENGAIRNPDQRKIAALLKYRC